MSAQRWDCRQLGHYIDGGGWTCSVCGADVRAEADCLGKQSLDVHEFDPLHHFCYDCGVTGKELRVAARARGEEL